MSKVLDGIDDELAAWLHQQRVFFVVTAPLSSAGHVNCSPKGGDCFRLTGPQEAAYLDYTGSGAETIAHLRENGRIVLMFCAFDGKPNIVRLHGQGSVILPEDADWARLSDALPPNPGGRAIIHFAIDRVSSSCGFSVPLLEHKANRDILDRWAVSKGDVGLAEYRAQKNARSIDGLPALAPAEASGEAVH